MKYRLTPLNIICGLAIALAIYSDIRPGSEGWGFLLTIYLVPAIIIGLLLDLLLQKSFTRYLNTFTAEILLFAILFVCYSLTQRTKTFIIPDRMQSQYLATIYGVENAPKLPNGWNYEIKIPTNGILLTSSKLDNDLPETKMKTYSGIELNSKVTELSWGRISTDKFDCNGKAYKYQLWMVDSSCCMYSIHDIDSFKIILRRQFCRQ